MLTPSGLLGVAIACSCSSDKHLSLNLTCGKCQAFRFVEFFAGESNVTWCMRRCGFAGLKFDSTYGGRYNNIFEPAGFAWPCCTLKAFAAFVCVCVQGAFKGGKSVNSKVRCSCNPSPPPAKLSGVGSGLQWVFIHVQQPSTAFLLRSKW